MFFTRQEDGTYGASYSEFVATLSHSGMRITMTDPGTSPTLGMVTVDGKIDFKNNTTTAVMGLVVSIIDGWVIPIAPALPPHQRAFVHSKRGKNGHSTAGDDEDGSASGAIPNRLPIGGGEVIKCVDGINVRLFEYQDKIFIATVNKILDSSSMIELLRSAVAVEDTEGGYVSHYILTGGNISNIMPHTEPTGTLICVQHAPTLSNVSVPIRSMVTMTNEELNTELTRFPRLDGDCEKLPMIYYVKVTLDTPISSTDSELDWYLVRYESILYSTMNKIKQARGAKSMLTVVKRLMVEPIADISREEFTLLKLWKNVIRENMMKEFDTVFKEVLGFNTRRVFRDKREVIETENTAWLNDQVSKVPAISAMQIFGKWIE
jgi:hypothetical protein